MAVEIQAVRPHAKRMQMEPKLPQRFIRKHSASTRLPFQQCVQLTEEREIFMPEHGHVGLLCDASFPVQLFQQDLHRIGLCIGERLVAPQPVAQKRNVLRQHRACPVRIPSFRLQRIDHCLSSRAIHVHAAEIPRQLPVFVLRIQKQNFLSRFQRVDDQQAQQMALALPAVAQDEDAAVGSVARAPVEVDDNIAAVLVPSQQEATGICFA